MRGYFEIGIFSPKFGENYGTLARSAYQMGASGIFTIGCRFQKSCEDTCKSFRHVPTRSYENWEDFMKHKPMGVKLVAIEDSKYQGKFLKDYKHPESAIYVLGNEATGIPEEIIKHFDDVVSIEFDRFYSFNVAVAGSIVMWDRYTK